MISQDVANVYDIEAAAVQAIASLSVSHQQVYNEQVDDLLNSEHQSGIGHNLNVRDGGIVNGLTWIRCSKPDEMLEAFTRARANVVYAETKMNKASSRSHAIFQLRISHSVL
ncbi:KIF18B [Symbiodinium sp. CCMP2456]|nr:KIF18B [Symbiodinium sp. CCMP2456]